MDGQEEPRGIEMILQPQLSTWNIRLSTTGGSPVESIVCVDRLEAMAQAKARHPGSIIASVDRQPAPAKTKPPTTAPMAVTSEKKVESSMTVSTSDLSARVAKLEGNSSVTAPKLTAAGYSNMSGIGEAYDKAMELDAHARVPHMEANTLVLPTMSPGLAQAFQLSGAPVRRGPGNSRAPPVTPPPPAAAANARTYASPLADDMDRAMGLPGRTPAIRVENGNVICGVGF